MAKGVTPIGPSDYVPIIKSTVTYIVLVVLVNDDDEVLMMQEAKSSCAGQWYLPAGRVEPGEDLHVSHNIIIILVGAYYNYKIEKCAYCTYRRRSRESV